MGIELSKGDFFMTIGDETTLLGSGIPFTEEIKLEAKEYLSHHYYLNTGFDMNFTVNNIDLKFLDNVCNMPSFNHTFLIKYQVPIMIQARWHKKPRIRKKWLKRFGMKPDVVNVQADAKVLEYNPGHILDEQYDPNGIYGTFDSFEFETDTIEYLWRPDQLRSGLKIEW